MPERTIPEDLIKLLLQAQRIAICSHVNPDGDTMGSALAIRMGLMQLGKQVSVFCQDKVPDVLHILNGWMEYTPDIAGQHFDLLLCVDISDEKRMGTCVDLLKQADHTAQIDHHGTNPLFCEVNVVDAAAPAVGIMAYALLRRLKVVMTLDMATCLYAAISTDTGNFAFSSTNAETFKVMAELMQCNLPLSRLNKRLFRVHPRCQVELLGRALNSLHFYRNGEVSSMMLTQRDFDECGALPEHADTVVNYGLEVSEVKMAVLARDNGNGMVKMSLRAVDGEDVAVIAQQFGGGGHQLASGCSLKGEIHECLMQVVDAMIAALDRK